jgi:hypothetical protein
MLVFFFFLVCLTWGSVSTLFWIPEEEMGRGYFQMNALVILGLLTLAVVTRWLHPFEPFGDQPALGAAALHVGYVGAFLYYGAVWRENWRWVRWPAGISLVGLGIALLEAIPSLTTAGTGIPGLPALAAIAILTSGLLLGWSLITMLLGHWYLVAPKLDFRHLTIFNWVLLATVVLKTASFGASLWAASSAETQSWGALTSFTGEAMFLWIRVLWGLVGSLLLTLMALHCSRRQSNQSATGILYVMVVGAFIGEITAYYLILTTGVPV